jgi:flagellar basal body-associated protein FliL
MQKETIVRSYVRSYKQEANEEAPEQSNFMGYLLGGGAVTILAIQYIGITLAVVALAGAVYGMKVLTSPVATVEAVTQPQEALEVKPKRHYQRRITVNHYQMHKSVRI